jgi:hypothetical protein
MLGWVGRVLMGANVGMANKNLKEDESLRAM